MSSDGRILMVEWLGRGGFAHTAEAWVHVLRQAGSSPLLVTRAGRELAASVPEALAIGAPGGPLASHLAAAARTGRLLVSGDCSHLVLHGIVAPQLELPLLGIARRHHVTSVLVAHEAGLAREAPGGRWAFQRMVKSADVVVAHSEYVARQLRSATGRSNIAVVPHPLPVGLLGGEGPGHLHTRGASAIRHLQPPVALHYGHLHRGYKGTDTVAAVAAAGVAGWNIAVVGKGAPDRMAGAFTADRFLAPAELVATVADSAATLLPYQRASQSGAVVLSQVLGSIVLATDVGGIAEQIEDGVSGLLLEPGASPTKWRDLLMTLNSEALRREMVENARSAVQSRHKQFVQSILALLGVG